MKRYSLLLGLLILPVFNADAMWQDVLNFAKTTWGTLTSKKAVTACKITGLGIGAGATGFVSYTLWAEAVQSRDEARHFFKNVAPKMSATRKHAYYEWNRGCEIAAEKKQLARRCRLGSLASGVTSLYFVTKLAQTLLGR